MAFDITVLLMNIINKMFVSSVCSLLPKELPFLSTASTIISAVWEKSPLDVNGLTGVNRVAYYSATHEYNQ